MSGTLLWIAKDVHYLNDEISLKQITFEEHILNSRGRLEFEGKELILKETVEEPIYIFQDKEHTNRIHYISFNSLETLDNKFYFIDVCVDTKDKTVCTAFPNRKIPYWANKGGVLYEKFKKI